MMLFDIPVKSTVDNKVQNGLRETKFCQKRPQQTESTKISVQDVIYH